MIGKKLDKDGICELLTLLWRSPAVLFPVAQMFGEARRQGSIVDKLCASWVFKRLWNKVRNVSADQEVQIDMEGIGFL